MNRVSISQFVPQLDWYTTEKAETSEAYEPQEVIDPFDPEGTIYIPTQQEVSDFWTKGKSFTKGKGPSW